LAHSFRTAGDHRARWLTVHARDGGFAACMRGVRDGVEVEWDISAVPADGGLATGKAIVGPGAGERPESGNRLCRLRCAVPDMRVVEWQVDGPHRDLPIRRRDDQVDSFVVIEGALQATLDGTTPTMGPGTLLSVPCGVQLTLDSFGPGRLWMLSIHTPGGSG